MTFSNQQFPVNIAYGSQGGPRHSSSILEQPSGQRKVTTRWNGALRRWDAKYGIRKQSDLYAVYQFVLAHNGAEHTFRYRDPLDFSSNSSDGSSSTVTMLDQTIGVGNGVAVDFQIIKTYTTGPMSTARVIQLPKTDTVLVAIGGVLQTEGVHYTLNYLTGIITFASAVPNSYLVQVGFLFDCHAQFSQEVDQLLSISLTAFKVGEIPSITIDEVPNPAADLAERSMGGSATINLTSDVRISLNTGEVLSVSTPSTGRSLWLPNPRGMGTGKFYFLIKNAGPTNSFDIRTHTGAVDFTLSAGYTVSISLVLNADSSKSWVYS